MGRPLKAKATVDDGALKTLLADNERLERERVELMAQPRTVANQITHQWLSIAVLSNLRSMATAKGNIPNIVALTAAIDKCENALRGLQKNKIDDELDAIVARIQGGDEARAILASVGDDD